ncbi:uncharacterized protein EV154DRAFT_34023 [Mucor mucedo]|uniref:uncharacterized protein n=1 Tax=Mucor mucedo TaxID=29922 RepID=UPI00221F7D4D|nr:uncharacterized protein EV154DRAFT_34023 [Mucor mucedo]KAI7895127.1 hypothetical protein EV154DRAFT_34023 [Mucor mucedo]
MYVLKKLFFFSVSSSFLLKKDSFSFFLFALFFLFIYLFTRQSMMCVFVCRTKIKLRFHHLLSPIVTAAAVAAVVAAG